MTGAAISAIWQAPFRASDYRLRFELGGEAHGSDEPVPRFVQAFSRARSVAHDLFQKAERSLAIVGTWPEPEKDLFAPASDGFAALAAMGFRPLPMEEWRAPHRYDHGDDELWTWRAFDIAGNWEARDVLLWGAIAYESRIMPKAPVKSYLVDFGSGVMLDVYDDRGMDVIATQRESLLDLYRSRGDWLLDYDRPRMAAVFGEPVTE